MPLVAVASTFVVAASAAALWQVAASRSTWAVSSSLPSLLFVLHLI